MMDGRPIAYLFDDVRIDLEGRKVFKAGEHVRIEPKAFEVLIYLIKYRKRIVTKDELLDEVWKNNEDVAENILAHHVLNLRRALGDDPHKPRCIEAIPRRGYRFIAKVRVERARIESIAVLPFKTLGAGSGDEYEGMGLAEVLITRLSNTGQFVVRQLSAVLKYPNTQDPLVAGREQRVDAVLNGNIQRDGDRMRVTMHLYRVSDGKPLWNGDIAEKSTDIFAVQDAVSKKVVEGLTSARRYTENEEAYLAYLKGRLHWSKRTVPGFEKSVECFQQAIEIDPSYALAYTGLADSYTLLGVYVDLPPREAFPKAKGAAEKVLEIDDTLADAHVALSAIRLFYEWDWQGAEHEFKRAVELNPNLPYAHQWNGLRLVALGRFDEAMSEMERAQKLDPLSLIINTNVGWVHYFARRYDEALEQLLQTVELDPNFARVRVRLGMAYEQKGMHQEAIAEYLDALRLVGEDDDPYVKALLGYTYATSGQRDKAREIFGQLRELQQQRYVPPYSIALIHAGLGEKDQSFEWLEKAFADRSYPMLYLKVEPMLDGLRSDPRMSDLVRRMGLVS